MSTRLPALDLTELDARQQSLVEEWSLDRNQSAPPSEIWRVVLRSPGGFQVLGKLGAFARMGTALPQELRVVASFAASTQRAYAFEIKTQRENLRRAGWTESQVNALARRDLLILREDTAAVARLAYTVADHVPAHEDVLDAVLRLLGDQGVIEVVMVTAYFCMLADIAGALGCSAD